MISLRHLDTLQCSQRAILHEHLVGVLQQSTQKSFTSMITTFFISMTIDTDDEVSFFLDTDYDLPKFHTSVPSSVSITRDNIFTQQTNVLCAACHAKVCVTLHPHAVASFPTVLTCSNRRREPTVLLPRLLLLLMLLKSSVTRLFQTSTSTCLCCLCQ